MAFNKPQMAHSRLLAPMGDIDLHPYKLPMQPFHTPQPQIRATGSGEKWVNGQLG